VAIFGEFGITNTSLIDAGLDVADGEECIGFACASQWFGERQERICTEYPEVQELAGTALVRFLDAAHTVHVLEQHPGEN
jgi:hypothetical protein